MMFCTGIIREVGSRGSHNQMIIRLTGEGWYTFLSRGGKSYLRKDGINGLAVEVDQATGAAKVHAACPIDYAERHMPQALK